MRWPRARRSGRGCVWPIRPRRPRPAAADLGQLRRLAGTGFAAHDDDLVRAYRSGDLVRAATPASPGDSGWLDALQRALAPWRRPIRRRRRAAPRHAPATSAARMPHVHAQPARIGKHQVGEARAAARRDRPSTAAGAKGAILRGVSGAFRARPRSGMLRAAQGLPTTVYNCARSPTGGVPDESLLTPRARRRGRPSFAASAAADAKTLRWVVGGDPQTMDPYSQNENLTNNINALIYDTLVMRDKDLKVIPASATSWELVNLDDLALQAAPGRQVPRRKRRSRPTTSCSRSSARSRIPADPLLRAPVRQADQDR